MNSNKLVSVSNEAFQVFKNNEFGNLEVITIDGSPYFPATSCAKILGYNNPHKAIIDHCRYLTKREVPHPQSSRKTIEVNFIPEADLYRLIAKSKLPAAENFERWVFEEVLPTIRKHGMYVSESLLDDPDLAIKAFTAIKEEREKNRLLEAEKKLLEAENAELTPKAEYHDSVLNKKGLICTSTIAKDIGLRSAASLNKILKDNKVIYRDGSGVWKPYADYVWLITEAYADYQSYSNLDATPLLKWTEKGRQWIIDNFASNVEGGASKGERGAV